MGAYCVSMEAQTLTEVVESLETNEYGTLADDERFEITVEYETRSGNTRSRTGEVWAMDDHKFGGDIIRFSAGIGTDDEDSYYIHVMDRGAELVSVSEMGNRTELGDVESIDADVDEATEDDDTDEDIEDVMAAFDEPEQIEEGMELTEPDGEDVYLLKSVDGGDTTVSIWNDGRRKRKERMPTSDLQTAYDHDELVVV